ncbi:MAG: hypothetical protein IKB34_08315 [Clostridia bacterium]|nr:hypothetical protein [Clostridia bacterium]
MTADLGILSKIKGIIIRRSVLDGVLLCVAYFLPLLAVKDQNVLTAVSLLYLCFFVYFAFSDWFCAFYPILFFFYDYLVAPGDIVVYRVYTVIFLLRFVYIHFGRGIKNLSLSRIGLALFMLGYAAFFFVSGRAVGIGVLIDLIFMLSFICEIRESSEAFSGFCIAFVAAAAVSGAVGFFLDRSDAASLLNNRYLATLNDPNYLGFYINVGIIIVFLHPFFKRLIFKLPALAVLYLVLLASESMTGVICNVLIVLFCALSLAFMKRLKLRYMLTLVLVFVVAIQMLLLASSNDWGILTSASQRILTKLEEFASGNIEAFTTTRSLLWDINIEKFLSLSEWEVIFGGSFLSAVGRDTMFFEQTSHQEFLDVLICTGAVGLIVYLMTVVFALSGDIAKLCRDGEELDWIRLGVKLIWLFYAFGLTMFLNSRFYILFLL